MSTRNAWLSSCCAIALCAITGCASGGWSAREVPDTQSLENGSQVTILQRNGEKVTGIFRGLEDFSEAEYKSLYRERQLSQMDLPLPSIGETIFLSTSVATDKYWEGTLLGFDRDGMRVRLNGENSTEDYFLTSLYRVADKQGNSLLRLQLRELYIDGKLPLMTAVVLENASGLVRIPADRIDLVIDPTPKSTEEFGTMTIDGASFRRWMLR